MNNKGILLRAPQVKIPAPDWVGPLADELTGTNSADVKMFRAMLIWCYEVGEAAERDAWDLLVHATQVMLHGRWSSHTSVREAREVIGEVARRLIAAKMIRA